MGAWAAPPVGSATARAGDTAGTDSFWMLLGWVDPRREAALEELRGTPGVQPGLAKRQARGSCGGIHAGRGRALPVPSRSLCAWARGSPRVFQALVQMASSLLPQACRSWPVQTLLRAYMGSSHILPTAATPGHVGEAGP